MEDRDNIIDCTKPIRLPDDCSKLRKNFTQGYFNREIGRYKNLIPSEFQWAAEDKLINKNTFEEVKCQLPDSPRSTFLMVFSPDGKKVASTHGNHNVYVTDLTTGKNIQTLSGHPRTPWCIAFHPSSNQILASGCLGGQVRVWDLHGGSEVWTAQSQTVIASLAFHPVDRMLVIATYNELHFWDWSQPEPFAKCSTKSEREKVRYVSFDRLGNKLITGIANPVNVPSQWDRINLVNSQSPSTTTVTTPSFSSSTSTTVANSQASTDQGRSITFCYRHLMNQYNQLVNRYFDLSRSRITPTIDRGTDPMDLLDLRNNGNTSESNTTTPSPSTSNSQSNSSSPLRFKITRSASRTYRPLSSRERFRIHSSIFSRLNSRSSLPSNSFPFSTNSSSVTNQNPTFTTPPSQSTARLRRCALSLGPTARSWCLTFSPESSSNLFFTRNTAPHSAGSSSGAVTNPTYTSYSDRGIFSTRESTSSNNNAEGSQFSVVWPYRVLLDDVEDHRLTIHRTGQQDGATPSNSSANLFGESAARSESGFHPTRTSRDSSRSSFGDSDRDRDGSRPSSGFPFRRHRSDLLNFSRNSAHPDGESTSSQESSSYGLSGRPSSRFLLTPVDLRSGSPETRYRDSERHERRFSGRSQSQSLTQSLMHPRPVPRFQVRSRLPQDHQSQLHLLTNRETHGVNLQNNQNLRRQLSFRPGGQFVLSRHSNSPFQPRVSHQVNTSPGPGDSKGNSASRPETSSRRLAASTFNSPEGASTSSSSEGNAFSPSSVASNLSFTGTASSRQLREQIKTRLFDRVEMMLRDRMRNSSSDIPSIDSTVNYSQISRESETDAESLLHSLESEDLGISQGLGPRGADPMLSSASDNRDASNDSLLSPDSATCFGLHGPLTATTSASSSSFAASQNPSSSEILDLWDSEPDTTPFSLNSNLPLNDILLEPAQPNGDTPSGRSGTAADAQDPTPSSNTPSASHANSSPSAELSMRQGIQRLSLHIENMQRLCWSRIESLQRQKIREMWEELTNQIRQFHNTIQSRTEEDNSAGLNQSDNSNSGSDIPSLRDLAISSSPAPGSSASSSSDLNYSSVINGYKELVESMVNELFAEARKSKKGKASNTSQPSTSDDRTRGGSNSSSSTATTATASDSCQVGGSTTSKNEAEEPQPGPSGLSGSGSMSFRSSGRQSRSQNLDFRLYKLFIETLHRERRRRDLRAMGAGPSAGFSRQNHYFRLRNSSRVKFRSHRLGRQILGFLPSRSRTMNRELEAILKARRKERSAARLNPSPSETSGNPSEPSTSTFKPATTTTATTATSGDACQSCGQKKKPMREYVRQKRRSVDSVGHQGTSGSACKLLKNSVGERSHVSSEETTDPAASAATPSTSTSGQVGASSSSSSSSSSGEDGSTNELLRQMIETMETMLRFLREAFCRTDESGDGQSGPGQAESRALPSSGDDSDDSDGQEQGEDFLRNLPQNFNCTKEIILNLMRDVTHLRAKKLLGFMVKTLTQFFGKNFENLIQVLDEQIFNLYMLLHLALELTDLLLDQLNARSREFERARAVDSANVSNVDNRAWNLLLSRSVESRAWNLLLSNSSSRLRDRFRHMSRSSYSRPFSSNWEDSLRGKTSTTNPYLPPCLRLASSRSGSRESGPSSSSSYSRSNTHLFNYVRKKRETARMSTAPPGFWCGRRGTNRVSLQPGSAGSGPSSRDDPSDGNSGNSRRGFHGVRGNNEEEDSNSGVRTFDYRNISNNNNNNNNNINNNSSANNNNNNNTDDDDDDDDNDNDNSRSDNRTNNNNNYNLNEFRTNISNSRSNNNNSSNNLGNNNNNSNNRNNSSSNNNNNNNNESSGNTSNSNSLFNHYFPAGSTTASSDSSNNNFIIVTGLSSANDAVNGSGSSVSNSRTSVGEGGPGSRSSGSGSGSGSGSTPVSSGHNPLPPLRSMEVTLSRNENGDLSLRDERPIFWIRYGGSLDATSGSSGPGNDAQSRVNTFTVPVVQVNDVPVPDVSMLNQPRHQPQSPVPRVPEDVWRWRAWRPRLLHPRYSGPNPFDDQDSNDVPENIHYYRTGSHLGVYTLDPMIITDAPLSPHHRIQAWDFSRMIIPDISDREANGVVPECKIHNDASVDVSNDGHLLVTLLPSGRLSVTTMLGVYSLDWSSLGQLLYRTSFEQNAVSVSLSPTNRHLLVGLASRPVLRDRTNMAQIFRLEGGRPSPQGGSWQSGRGRLVHMRDLEQTRETNTMSLNCIRWAPGAGQGLVFGTNTGLLKVLR